MLVEEIMLNGISGYLFTFELAQMINRGKEYLNSWTSIPEIVTPVLILYNTLN